MYANVSPSTTSAHNTVHRNSNSPRPPVPNVIVFGETGAGKSSVINMLRDSGGVGEKYAGVSDSALGVTFSNTAYEKTIKNRKFRVFDTAGLNEGSAGTIKPADAIIGLYKLIHQLSDGVSLLVYVMRAPRIKSTAKPNYDVFHDIFCQKHVPIVIIITGLEAREDMGGWWEENKRVFARHQMTFDGHACITATKGKLRRNAYCYEDEYNESKEKVESLIYQCCRAQPWGYPPKTWFDMILLRLINLMASLPVFERLSENELSRALQTYGDFSGREAIAEAVRLNRKLGN